MPYVTTCALAAQPCTHLFLPVPVSCSTGASWIRRGGRAAATVQVLAGRSSRGIPVVHGLHQAGAGAEAQPCFALSLPGSPQQDLVCLLHFLGHEPCLDAPQAEGQTCLTDPHSTLMPWVPVSLHNEGSTLFHQPAVGSRCVPVSVGGSQVEELQREGKNPEEMAALAMEELREQGVQVLVENGPPGTPSDLVSANLADSPQQEGGEDVPVPAGASLPVTAAVGRRRRPQQTE